MCSPIALHRFAMVSQTLYFILYVLLLDNGESMVLLNSIYPSLIMASSAFIKGNFLLTPAESYISIEEVRLERKVVMHFFVYSKLEELNSDV